jgi:hypothetical protein
VLMGMPPETSEVNRTGADFGSLVKWFRYQAGLRVRVKVLMGMPPETSEVNRTGADFGSLVK